VAGDADDDQAQENADLVKDLLLVKKRNRLADRVQHRQFITLRAGHARPIHLLLRTKDTIAYRFLAECPHLREGGMRPLHRPFGRLDFATGSTSPLPAKRAYASPLMSESSSPH